MKLKPAIAAILSATALLASSGAFADSFSLGVLPAIPNAPVPVAVPKPTGGLSDFFSFVLPAGWTQALATANFTLTPGIQDLSIKLWNDSLTTVLATGSFAAGGVATLDTAGLTPGTTYAYQVTGFANAPTSYSFAAQAVPEPGTYALFLAGLTAVGWVARRRRVA